MHEFFPVAYNGNGTGSGIGRDIWSPSGPNFNGSIMEAANTIAGSNQSMPFYYTKIYANGLLIVDWEKTIDTTDTHPFQIGLYGWPEFYFYGLIDEVRVYNCVLSAGEALWLAGITSPIDKPF